MDDNSLDVLASPRRRLSVAKKKLDRFKKRTEVFFNKEPYTLGADFDPVNNMDVYKLKIIRHLPESMADLAWEIVDNFRTCLDKLGYGCAIGSGKINPKNTYFPISESAAQLQTDVIGRGRCKDIPHEILDVFCSFNPYRGGNDPIWILNKLANFGKHRLDITAAAAVANGFQLGHLQIEGEGALHPPTWNSEKAEMIVLTAKKGTVVQADLSFAFFVAFGPVEPVSGQNVSDIFDAIAITVEGILTATETEARRLRIIQ